MLLGFGCKALRCVARFGKKCILLCMSVWIAVNRMAFLGFGCKAVRCVTKFEK